MVFCKTSFFNCLSLLFICSFLKITVGFNIDTIEPIIKSTRLVSKVSQLGYFGFSVALHQENLLDIDNQLNNKAYWLLVGSPFDNENIGFKQNDPTGAVYKCPMTALTQDCKQFSLEMSHEYIVKKNQLLGFTVNSGTDLAHNQTNAYTCYPGRINKKDIIFQSGGCIGIKNNLAKDSLQQNVFTLDFLKACKDIQNHFRTDMEKRICSFGYSFAVAPSNKDNGYIIGVPFYNSSIGSVVTGVISSDPSKRPTANYFHPKDQSYPFSYAGYSLSSGNILATNNIDDYSIVIGQPGISTSVQSSGNGSIIIALQKHKKVAVDHSSYSGEQFGSRFGHSVLAVDVNGDKWDEVLVGAPFLTVNDGIEIGGAYLYRNIRSSTGRPLDNPPIRILPIKSSLRGQFGASLAAIGDVNRDGFQDFAIGAPFENSKGAVYIYHGNKKFDFSKPSQHISASSINPGLSGFGFSLSGNVDIDRTGYPDIAIGSVLSDQAVVLRSIPIIDIFIAKPAITTAKISKSNMRCSGSSSDACLELNLKFYYVDRAGNKCLQSGHSYNIHSRVVVDPDNDFEGITRATNRTGPQITSHATCGSASTGTIGHTFNLFMSKDKFMNRVDPLVIRIYSTPDFPKRVPNLNKLTSLSNYPILDPKKNFVDLTVPFENSCDGENSCEPDLKIKFVTSLLREHNDYVLYVGQDSKIFINVTVTNVAIGRGNTNLAHQTFLRMNFSKSYFEFTTANPGPFKAGKFDNLICHLANPLMPGKSASCNVELKVKDLLDGKSEANLYINSTVTVHKSAKWANDLTKLMKIRIKMMTNLVVAHSVEPSQVLYDNTTILGASAVLTEQKIGGRFTLTYTISNNLDNSMIPSSRLVILWPYETVGDPKEPHGKYLLYMLSPPKVTSINKQNITCDAEALKSLVNILDIRVVNKGGINVLKDTIQTPAGLGPVKLNPKASVKSTGAGGNSTKPEEVDTVTLSCANGTARCLALTCKLGPLSSKSTIKIEINARLWSHTMKEDYKNARYVRTVIQATWKPDVNFDIIFRSGTKPVVEKVIRKKTVQDVVIASNTIERMVEQPKHLILIICLAVAGGFILLIVIVIVLWKLKFFQRKRFDRRGTIPERAALHNYQYDD